MAFTFLCILTVIICLFLIAITMVQSSKKEDEGNSLGNMGVHVLMGVQQTNEFLTGGTWILLGSLFLVCLAFHSVTKNKKEKFVSPTLAMLKEQNKNVETEEGGVKKVEESGENGQDNATENGK